MLYRDSVRPCSRHFAATTGLTITQFWWSDVDLSPRTAVSNDCDTGSGSGELSFLSSFQDSSILIITPEYAGPSNRHPTKIWFEIHLSSDPEDSWANSNIANSNIANSNIAQLTALFAALRQAQRSVMFIRTCVSCGGA